MEGTPQQPSVPAGWYPDPNGEGLRYWDGTAWTGHTAPAAGGEAQGAAATAAGSGGQATAGSGGQAAGAAAAEQSVAAGSAQQEEVAGAQQQPAAAGAPGAMPQQQGAAGAAAPQAEDRASGLEWTLSILFALVVPLVGLIWGIYLKRQGGAKETPGNVALVLSLVVILIAVLLLR